MRPLRYSINVTLDGCVDHTSVDPDAELHRYSMKIIAQADALIFGRVMYGMMEGAFRAPAETEIWPEGMVEWMRPFARTIHAAKKYVASDTLERVDWNADLIRGDRLEETVRKLKQEDGNGLYVAGVTLPLALAELGLIDEYEFLVHPRLVGHGPTPFAGLSKPVDLKFVGQQQFGSGAAAMRYEVRR